MVYKNKSEIKQYQKYHYQLNKVGLNMKHKQYKESHKDQEQKRDKKYRLTHKEQIKKYREAHKEKFKQYMKIYTKIHEKELKEKAKIYWEKNKQRFKERKIEYWKKRNNQLRNAIFDKFGNKCARCGFSDVRALQIDHINGGGGREKKMLKNNNWALFQKVLADTTGKYQLLCANCNWIKKVENGEVGNQYKKKLIYEIPNIPINEAFKFAENKSKEMR
jgi:hypothetical protein